MAHKTFISYKFSESQDLRDRIIESLGPDAKYYQGETSDSPDLTDCRTETIKSALKDMIYSTSVTIVILSLNMRLSSWIPWEISYSLRNVSRDGISSKSNGIVAVIQKHQSIGYSWFINPILSFPNKISYQDSRVPSIVSKNTNNILPEYYNLFDNLSNSYISYIKEGDFLVTPSFYIDNAFIKGQNISHYNIHKTI